METISMGSILLLLFIAAVLGSAITFSFMGFRGIFKVREKEEEENHKIRSISYMHIAITIFLFATSIYIVINILDYLHITPNETAQLHSLQEQVQRLNKASKTEETASISIMNVGGDSMENLLEILGILLAIGAVVAYVFRSEFRGEINKMEANIDEKYNTVREEDTKLSEKDRIFTEAQMFKLGGLASYYKFLIYVFAGTTAQNITIKSLRKKPIEILDMIDAAIGGTTKGLIEIEKLDTSLEKNLLECTLKNNYAWFYLQRLNFVSETTLLTPEEKKKELEKCHNMEILVLRYIEFVHACAGSFPEERDDFEETYRKVKKKILVT